MQHCRLIVWATLIIFATAVQAEDHVYGEQRISGWWNWLKTMFRKPESAAKL